MLSNVESVETLLQRIAAKARSEPGFQFTSLFHLMDVDLLRGCFAGLRTDAAAGIDRVTKQAYGQNLEENLTALVMPSPPDGISPATGKTGVYSETGE